MQAYRRRPAKGWQLSTLLKSSAFTFDVLSCILSSFGKTEEKVGEYVEDLAASMFASTLGVEFDANQSWDEEEQLFKLSEKIARTSNITRSAVVDIRALPSFGNARTHAFSTEFRTPKSI